MPERTLTIYEEDVLVERIVDSSGIDVIDDGANRVIEIFAEGPAGPVGSQGPAGFSGAGEPFYVVTSGSLYATTASLALLASVSSSIIPWTSSFGTTFDVGSLFAPWRSVYVSESIFIVKSCSVLVELKGSQNTLEIGRSKIATASFGFENPVISRVTTGQQTMVVNSGSISASFDESGQLLVPSFEYAPIVKYGSLFVSGSDLFIGL